ncbi:MAG TPA: hypothetical protein VK846_07270 [Candidatus Limnocylindria bacterium]|nr:hypothetical protein [Candidatus Limnocylindria bacterium]
MNIGSTGKIAAASTKDLLRKWTETRDAWHDARSAEFERRHVRELEAAVDRAAPVFEMLEKLVTRIRKDCE